MSYILTVTGKHFDPVEPEEYLIDIHDIAHALSMICRANGHFPIFYSVAQHSIACAEEAIERGLSGEIILGCLLHDASEAYLSDVTRPVKKDLPYYLNVEEKLQNLIWKHFIGRDLTEDEKKTIFEIDDQMLSMEFHQLMPEGVDDSWKQLKRGVICEYMLSEEVKDKFLYILEGIIKHMS